MPRPPSGWAFAIRAASWTLTMALTMASPSPVPAGVADPLGGEPLERLEEAVHLVRRDQRPGVADGQDRPPVVGCCCGCATPEPARSEWPYAFPGG